MKKMLIKMNRTLVKVWNFGWNFYRKVLMANMNMLRMVFHRDLVASAEVEEYLQERLAATKAVKLTDLDKYRNK